MFTELIKEATAYATPVLPVNCSTNVTTGLLDMSVFARAALNLSLGVKTGTGTLQCSLFETNYTDYSLGTAITGGSLVPISAGMNENTLEIQAPQMSKRYLYGVIGPQPAGAAYSIQVCATLEGREPRFSPATSYNSGTISQQVATTISTVGA